MSCSHHPQKYQLSSRMLPSQFYPPSSPSLFYNSPSFSSSHFASIVSYYSQGVHLFVSARDFHIYSFSVESGISFTDPAIQIFGTGAYVACSECTTLATSTIIYKIGNACSEQKRTQIEKRYFTFMMVIMRTAVISWDRVSKTEWIRSMFILHLDRTTTLPRLS